jgi:HPt (histidine-containing phosphotransfer) domain-containing protein
MLHIEKVTIDPVHSVATPSSSASVDLAVLANYEKLQLDGESDLIVELIDLYLDDALRRVAVMQDSLASNNWASLKREAHTLRGSSGNLGALQMVLICEELEGMEFADLSPTIEVMLGCLVQELKRVNHVFLAERQRRLQCES